MTRHFAGPVALCLGLFFLTGIPIAVALAGLVQLPTGTLPPGSQRFAAVPVAFLGHAAAGVVFGVIGPLQFVGVLRRRFGRLHRLAGRVFALAGALLALSGLRLLAEFPGTSTPIIDLARIAASVALLAALWTGIAAARARNLPRHRAWMVRAYAIGMGSGTVAFLLGPVYLITGEAPRGFLADAVFALSWAVNIALAEAVLRRIRPRPLPA